MIWVFAMIFQILCMFKIIQIYASLHFFFFMSAFSYIYGSCEWFCNESSTFCSLDHKNVYIPVTVLYYNSNIRIFAMMQIHASLQYIYIYILSASSYIYGNYEWFCNESSTICPQDHKNVYIIVIVLILQNRILESTNYVSIFLKMW